MQYHLKYLSNTLIVFYLNPTAACQTNTSKKKNKGINGRTSTVGAKALYASGNSANVFNRMSTFFDNLINYDKTLPRMVSNRGCFPRSEINCKTIIFNC